jgi:hypothetical protein
MSRVRDDSLGQPVSPPAVSTHRTYGRQAANEKLNSMASFYAQPENMHKLIDFLDVLSQCNNFDEIR